jgi:acetolactate synthase-1/2/3 large subunit
MLTGQVATHRLKGDRPVRQLGFQETDVVSIFKSVTKYAHQVTEPSSIRYHLERAYHLAFEGRPGSVLIDLPDDLQRAEVDPLTMRSYTPQTASSRPDLNSAVAEVLTLLKKAERPVLILGQGLSTPRVGAQFEGLIERLGVPVLLTWAGSDLLPYDHPLRVGPFGVYGPRVGNFTVQNADVVVALGTRLSQNVTGGILSSFAREATIVMVDASQGEMDKFDGRGIDVGLKINGQLSDFVDLLTASLSDYVSPGYATWIRRIGEWRHTLPNDLPPLPAGDARYVDAHHFVEILSRHIPQGETIFADTGGNLTWICNGLKLKRGQRLFSAWNNTPMGYALPAAIGAAVSGGGKPVTCVIGDGGLALCLGELATVSNHKLPIRIILFNNHCHGIQRQTLETWLDARYVGVDDASGLAFPDFPRVAEAMRLHTVTINTSADIDRQLAEIFAAKAPVFCNVEINPGQKLYPVTKFGFPLENQIPFMNPALLESQMIIGPHVENKDRSTHVGTAGV